MVASFHSIRKRIRKPETGKQDSKCQEIQGSKEGYFKQVMQCSQYFTLNLDLSKVIYASLVACVLF